MKTKQILLILFMTSLYACHKDACLTVQPVNADFTINDDCDACGSLWLDYVSDTTTGLYVVFNATLNNAQYEWIIGAVTYTQQNFYLDFNTAPNGSVIPITLIVHKTPNTKCYPGESDVDTLTKNMVINRTTNLFYGQWQGFYIDSATGKPTSDTEYVVTIKKGYDVYTEDSVPAIYGLQTVIDTIIYPSASYWSYKELLFSYPSPNGGIDGRALVDSTNNNITIRAYQKQFTCYFKGQRQ